MFTNFTKSQILQISSFIVHRGSDLFLFFLIRSEISLDIYIFFFFFFKPEETSECLDTGKSKRGLARKIGDSITTSITKNKTNVENLDFLRSYSFFAQREY